MFNNWTPKKIMIAKIDCATEEELCSGKEGQCKIKCSFQSRIIILPVVHNTCTHFVKGDLICPAGVGGSGGSCQCNQASGWSEGQWKALWCYDGLCYTDQAYDDCQGKDNGYQLGDGTWCWDHERQTKCPTISGKII